MDKKPQIMENDKYKMVILSNEHMKRHYEEFITEYYRQEHPELSDARAAQVKWDLCEEENPTIRFLPVIQTDVIPRKRDKAVIIDAKHYGHTLQQQYDKNTLHSSNVYQIFTCGKNQD